MFAGTYLLVALLAQQPEMPDPSTERAPPEGPADRLSVRSTSVAIELSWSDAEERLQGSIEPSPPVATREMRVSVNVGTFEGKSFDGPITLALHSAEHFSESATVKRSGVMWATTFHPPDEGSYTLDVSWRSTHNKVLHAPIEVIDAPAPRWPWLVLVGIGAALLLGFGVRSAVRSRRAE